MKPRFNTNDFFAVLVFVIVLMQFCCPSLWARSTATSQAQKVVRGWLKTNALLLGAAFGQQIEETETFTDDNGSPLYYVVYLQPSGFVIDPADDGTGSPATAPNTAAVQAVILDADFTGGLPPGWTIIDGGSSSHTWAPARSDDWTDRDYWEDGILNGNFMVVDSDSAGEEDLDEQLITPALDCSNLESLTLTFTHQFVYYSGFEAAAVDIRVNGGQWQNLLFYQDSDASGEVEVDISFADNQANVQIRWHYYDAYWDYYWGIDDVQVKGLMSSPEPPVAQDDSVQTYLGTAETIELQATDDGLPGPLTYIITSLPAHGTLEDVDSALIISTTPYSLSNNDNEVIYTPDADYTGPDEFTFKANDGQSDSNIATITIDVISSEISAHVTLDNLWMYQNVPTSTNSKLTASVSITDDALRNSSYSYEWEFILPDDVSTPPTIIDGGTSSDPCCTFAAPGCDQPDGLSDSGQALTIRVTVTGDDYDNSVQAEAQFGIALLGDVNNDGVVNDVADRAIINTFWRTGAADPYTFTDCNINCDTAVNVADRAIANAVWRGVLGQNSVSSPCPLR
ncbi:MAG: hypothetical protein DRP65_10460 [Planctomycetota bacterium]|nr:MAG: hypothetical protein DRP65_10460 [Planctomycetota bacterium]